MHSNPPDLMYLIAIQGKDSTFKFLETVLGEVIDLFPSSYIHIGGDEVCRYGQRIEQQPFCSCPFSPDSAPPGLSQIFKVYELYKGSWRQYAPFCDIWFRAADS